MSPSVRPLHDLFCLFVSVALRKIDSAALPSVDTDSAYRPSPSQPDQRSPPFIDASPKPSQSPVESFQRIQLAEKPHPSQLPPKPLLKDLPSRNKPSPAPAAPRTQGSRIAATESQSSIQQGERSPPPAAEDCEHPPTGVVDTPVPLPRKITPVSVSNMKQSFYAETKVKLSDSDSVLVFQVRSKIRRVKTIYDCEADNEDELAFAEGEVIVVTGEEDQEWWVGISYLQLITILKSAKILIFRFWSGFFTHFNER